MKKIGSILLTLALMLTLYIPAFGASFRDVPSGSALAGDVQKAVNYGLMTGYSSTNFGYSDSMTRAQFVTVLVRMFGWTVSDAKTGSFQDVSAESGYTPFIETAAAHNVVDSGGSFRPNAAITREEMSVMLVRALGLKSAAELAAKDSLPFTDVSSNRGYIAVAYTIGMTNGTSAKTFAPKATATRAQAAAMLVRIYEKYRQSTDFLHGFYAISSYSQLNLTNSMDAVSAGWSRMTFSGKAVSLSTTSAGNNEYYVPSGYDSVTEYLLARGKPLNLSVYMDNTDGALAQLLSSADYRGQAVAQIMQELTMNYSAIGRNPYSGVTIDFESLRSAQKADFNAFLKELSQKVHASGKKLYVCVFPLLTTGAYYDGYDYRTIGSLADKVILMAHDYNPRSLSGFEGTTYYKTTALAPIDQVYESLRAATDPSTGVQDVSKLVLAISCSTLAWQIDGSGKLLSPTPAHPAVDTVYKRLKQPDTVMGWSDDYQSPTAAYTTEDGERYFLWYEDSRSAASKVQLAKLFGIRGVSIWRLGTVPNYTDSGLYFNLLSGVR